MRIPLISLPLKSGEQVDFSDDVYKCIEMYYEQDPMAYSLDVTKLNSTREKIIKNNNGDKELVENIALYLSYIESFEKRFKPDVCKIEFIWYTIF